MNKITGQDIHEAYNDTLCPFDVRERYKQAGIPLSMLDYKQLPAQTQQIYDQIADRLNKKHEPSFEPYKPEMEYKNS